MDEKNSNMKKIVTNHHVFQPLLYQVAMAALSPGDIAVPIRSVFRNRGKVGILLENAVSIDKEKKMVYVNRNDIEDFIEYDYLVLLLVLNIPISGKMNGRNTLP